MSRSLVVYEDPHGSQLSPLSDLLPVPALRFGASTLSGRWASLTRIPLLAIEADPERMAAWRDRPSLPRPSARGDVFVVNAAVLPGAWVEGALAMRSPALFTAGGKIAGARFASDTLAPGLGRGIGFEPFLLSLGLPATVVEAEFLSWPWDIVIKNPEAIVMDLGPRKGRIEGELHPQAVCYEPARVIVEPGARIDAFAVLDARGGPILIERDVVVASHTVVVGPCVVGAGTQLLGGVIGRSTIGPECRIAGEVEESVWQGYSNKRHHGFVGHSVLGEWTNLGALTTTSDLKNNYGVIRSWAAGRARETGTIKLGAILGAHVKTGIGSLLPAGCSVGVGAHLFGGGRYAPKVVPAFGWWDGERMADHDLERCIATARTAMSRRGQALSSAEEGLLRSAFERKTSANAVRETAET